MPADGYDVVRSDTWTVFAPLRGLPLGGDVDKAKKQAAFDGSWKPGDFRPLGS